MISGPSLIAETRLLTFIRAQSRAVTCLLIGHNTLRIHLYVMGLMGSPLCRRHEAEEETSAYVLCECEVLASLRLSISAPFSWIQGMLEVKVYGQSRT